MVKIEAWASFLLHILEAIYPAELIIDSAVGKTVTTSLSQPAKPEA